MYANSLLVHADTFNLILSIRMFIRRGPLLIYLFDIYTAVGLSEIRRLGFFEVPSFAVRRIPNCLASTFYRSFILKVDFYQKAYIGHWKGGRVSSSSL